MRLEKGDELGIAKQEKSLKKKFSKIRVAPEHFASQELGSYPGPEYGQLNDKQRDRLTGSFTLSTNNNRVAYHINEPIENSLEPLFTSAVFPGTVQLTPSGKLIVLMKDCQVTGGYPRVLQLSEQAISRLSQKVAGEKVWFRI